MKYILELWCLVHLIYVPSCEGKKDTKQTKTKNRDESTLNSAKDRPQSTIVMSTTHPVSKIVFSSNFSKIRYSRGFVDKTLWIKDYWEKSESFLYVTAPPRFGKTVLMNTAMDFFNAVEDINRLQGNQNSFSLKKSFKGTKLYEDERIFFDDHYHKYIIMYFDLRPLATVTDMKSFEERFCGIICEMRELVHPNGDRTGKNPDGMRNCRRKCVGDFYFQSAALSKEFSKFLHSTYGKPIIVFVDEFDAFVYAMLNKKCSEPHCGFILDRLSEYFSPLLKGNDFVERCYVTGSLFLGGVMSPCATNINHVTFDSRELYAKYFGLTEEEVQSLLKTFGRSDLLPQVREYYDGYQVQNSDLKIYNTISVMKCLDNDGELDYYWANSVQTLADYLEFFSHPLIGKQIATVVIGDSIFSGSYKLGRTTFYDLQKLRTELLNEVPEVNCEQIFINYLEESGYLTRSRENRIELKATNEETRFALEYALLHRSLYFQKQRKISINSQNNLVKAVLLMSAVDSERSMQRLAKALHDLFSQDCSGVTDERVTFVGPIYGPLRFAMTNKQLFTKVSAEEKVNLTGLNAKDNRQFGKVDLTILFRDGSASIWELRFNKTVRMGMNDLLDRKYPALFDQKFIGQITNHRFYLAVNIDLNCRITIKYLIDSTNIADAKEVAYPEEKSPKNKSGKKGLRSRSGSSQ